MSVMFELEVMESFWEILIGEAELAPLVDTEVELHGADVEG